MKLFLFVCSITLLIASCAKSTFTYSEGMCSYSGKYNPKTISEEQLQNTLDHLIFPSYIETNATAWELDDVDDLDLEALKEECSTRLNRLETLEFANTENMVRLKESRIRELNEACYVKSLTILGYENPDTLMGFETTDENINFIRNGLIAGGDSLVEVWKEVVRIQKLNNGYPERIQQEFEAQFNSPEKLEYARLTVMMFGWWNNVNHDIYHTPDEYYSGQFNELFSKVDEECDY